VGEERLAQIQEMLEHARREIESWRTIYNEHGPDSSLGDRAPAQYVASLIKMGCSVKAQIGSHG
jgi:hypothetical protein